MLDSGCPEPFPTSVRATTCHADVADTKASAFTVTIQRARLSCPPEPSPSLGKVTASGTAGPMRGVEWSGSRSAATVAQFPAAVSGEDPSLLPSE